MPQLYSCTIAGCRHAHVGLPELVVLAWLQDGAWANFDQHPRPIMGPWHAMGPCAWPRQKSYFGERYSTPTHNAKQAQSACTYSHRWYCYRVMRIMVKRCIQRLHSQMLQALQSCSTWHQLLASAAWRNTSCLIAIAITPHKERAEQAGSPGTAIHL